MGKRSAAAVAVVVAVAKKTETEMVVVALPDWLICSNSSPSTFEGRAQFPLFDVSVRRSTHGDVERFRAYY